MQTLEFDVLPADHAPRMGLIVLQSDVTIEDEFRYYFEGVSLNLLVNRIPFENNVTIETLRQMEGHLTKSMSLFPLGAEFNCFGYACTSGALHIGTDRIAELVTQSRRCENVTNPMHAAIQAMQHVGIKRIAYLAPYSQQISQTMVDEFEQQSIDVIAAATFNEKLDQVVGRISPRSIEEAAIALATRHSVDAVFVSCTNMKCAHIIPRIEARSDVLALSSNQVLVWHMAKQADVQHSFVSKGRLFEC